MLRSLLIAERSVWRYFVLISRTSLSANEYIRRNILGFNDYIYELHSDLALEHKAFRRKRHES